MLWEGEEYENVPGDAGGPTKFGIDSRSNPGLNIRALTRDQAKGMYLREYRAGKAGVFAHPLDYMWYDCEVNMGASGATKVLQRAIGAVADGVWGEKTSAALRAALKKGPASMLGAFTLAREKRYKDIAHANASQHKFLRGWLNRNSAIKTWVAKRLEVAK